ncbi:hypothetical protein RB595_005120 [Gaeumannomyces hyphopodioides]
MAQQNEADPVPPATTAGEASGTPMVETGGYVWPTPIYPADQLSFYESGKQFPVKDCFREVDAQSWIIAGHLLLKRFPEATSPLPEMSWSADYMDGGYYTLENAPRPLPKTYPMGTTGERDPFGVIEGCDGRRGVFTVGAVILKISIVHPRYAHATREHTTLAWLKERKESFSFKFPEVVAHYEFNGRYFLFMTGFNFITLDMAWLRLPTLDQAWTRMPDVEKKAAGDRVAAFCHELAAFKKTDGLPSGVDGGLLGPTWLLPDDPDGRQVARCSPEIVARECEEMGMDCSDLVFAHNDLSLGNVLVDENFAASIVIDWETAGFVPREWVRTVGLLSHAYLMPPAVFGGPPSRDYADPLSEALQAKGYPEVAAKVRARLEERDSKRQPL